jgi:hypothetical protein
MPRYRRRVTETPPPAQPGWYPDPAGSSSLRWWSGASWTDDVTDAASPPGAPPTPYPRFVDAEPSSARQRSRHAVVLVLIAVVLALSAFAVATVALVALLGNGAKLDTTGVEQRIAEELTLHTASPTEVVCPESVPLHAGGTFTCVATADDGSTAQILVTQSDEAGDVTWVVTASG